LIVSNRLSNLEIWAVKAALMFATVSYSGSIIQDLGCIEAESVHQTVDKDGKESRRLQQSTWPERSYQSWWTIISSKRDVASHFMICRRGWEHGHPRWKKSDIVSPRCIYILATPVLPAHWL
jgi:hypothetical protein